MYLFAVSGFALVLFSSRTLLAQELSTRSGGNPAVKVLRGPGGEGASCSEGEPQKQTIEPYTANRKTKRVQTLANGTTITNETTSKEARDSSGRTYRENQVETQLGFAGQAPTYSFFNVSDPVSHVSISWNSNSKDATVFHMPDPVQPRPPSPPAATSTAAVQPARIPLPAHRKGKTEDLGTKTINGIEAHGTRTTETYPAGAFGNDQPITVTHEMWMSRELKLAVLQIDDDPRTGVRTTELTDIERGEPDPALFQVPEGYTVKDKYPNQQN
jgi:hypothetical protein